MSTESAPNILENNAQFRIESSGLLYLKFVVRVYSSSISNCTFWRYRDGGETDNVLQRHVRAVGCHSRSNLMPGTETTLEFIIKNVTSEASGDWGLLLIDGFGSRGTVNFSIVSSPVNAGSPRSVDYISKHGKFIAGGAGIIVIVIMGLLVVLIISCRRRDNDKHPVHMRNNGDKQKDITRDVLYRGSNVSLMISNNIYDSTVNFCTRPLPAPPPDGLMVPSHQEQPPFCQPRYDVECDAYIEGNNESQFGSKPVTVDYEEIGNVRKDRQGQPLLPPLPHHLRPEDCDTVMSCNGNNYASIDEIKKRKRQSEALKKAECCTVVKPARP